MTVVRSEMNFGSPSIAPQPVRSVEGAQRAAGTPPIVTVAEPLSIANGAGGGG